MMMQTVPAPNKKPGI
jgi:hypothetical protein